MFLNRGKSRILECGEMHHWLWRNSWGNASLALGDGRPCLLPILYSLVYIRHPFTVHVFSNRITGYSCIKCITITSLGWPRAEDYWKALQHSKNTDYWKVSSGEHQIWFYYSDQWTSIWFENWDSLWMTYLSHVKNYVYKTKFPNDLFTQKFLSIRPSLHTNLLTLYTLRLFLQSHQFRQFSHLYSFF